MFSKKHLYWKDLLFCQGHKLLFSFFFFFKINFTKYSLLWCHFSPLWGISIPRCYLLLSLIDLLPTRFHLFLCRCTNIWSHLRNTIPKIFYLGAQLLACTYKQDKLRSNIINTWPLTSHFQLLGSPLSKFLHFSRSTNHSLGNKLNWFS